MLFLYSHFVPYIYMILIPIFLINCKNNNIFFILLPQKKTMAKWLYNSRIKEKIRARENNLIYLMYNIYAAGEAYE